MKRIVILGSTGSIGTQTLDVVRAHPGEFEVLGLSARNNAELLEAQIKEFKPKYVVRSRVDAGSEQKLMELAQLAEADLIVNALAGVGGLMPTYAACKAGKKIALANKESLVMAGELLMEMAKESGARILPVDSEISALWQLLDARAATSEVEKIIITASGGPFLGWSREQLEKVTPSEALKHPTWKMGEKISVDSATLINKAFEVIEAHWLFGLPAEKIEVVVHPQSMVHGLVQWADGNITAAMSATDMRIPISYALFYPEHRVNKLPRPDFSSLELTFKKPDFDLFEGPKLAYEVLKKGGTAPAVLCLADELAVQKFLAGEIKFLDIYSFIKKILEEIPHAPLSLEAIQDLTKRIS